MFLLVACCLVQDPAEAVQDFRKAFPDAGLDEKILLVRELGRLRDPLVLEALAPLLTREHVTVRIVVARELAAFSGVPKTGRKLLEALQHSSNRTASTAGVRIVLVRSLGDLRHKDALSVLHSFFNVGDVWLAKAAIEACGKIRAKDSVGRLIQELGAVEPPPSEDSMAAAVIGSDPGSSRSPLDLMKPSTGIKLTDFVQPKSHMKAKVSDKKRETPAESEDEIRRREILWPAIQAALESITREKWTRGPEWQAWWRRNGAGFLPPK